MVLTDKIAVDALTGEAEMGYPNEIVNIGSYAGGIPEIDKGLERDSVYAMVPEISFKVHKYGLEIRFELLFQQSYAAVPLESLESVVLEIGGTIDVEERSVIGRAIVGGMFFGPFGAVVGAASGLKDRVVKDSNMLLLKFDEKGTTHSILVTINEGRTEEVRSFFTKHYASVFSCPRLRERDDLSH